MTASISVVVATFGDEKWRVLAERALGSVDAQTVKPASVLHVHGATLQESRNSGANESTGEWLVFLDADDLLDARYLEAMTAAVDQAGPGDWLIRPSTLGWHEDTDTFDAAPAVIPRYPLSQRNFMVIGTLVSRAQLLRVGGFGDECCMEDWALWIRCVLDGAQCISAPDAVYIVGVRPGSRNVGTKDCLQTVAAVRHRYGAQLKAVGE